MGFEKAKPKLLAVIAQHDGEWGWYQFERAFPPGWFQDVPAEVRVMTILDAMEAEGLVKQVPSEPFARYALTTKGRGEVPLQS